MKAKNLISGAGALCLVFALSSCGGSASKECAAPKAAKEWAPISISTTETVITSADGSVPEYTILEKTQYDLDMFPQDKDGYYHLFDGETFNGWRGYGRDDVPKRWIIEDGADRKSNV